jgi:hypothetical protein
VVPEFGKSKAIAAMSGKDVCAVLYHGGKRAHCITELPGELTHTAECLSLFVMTPFL